LALDSSWNDLNHWFKVVIMNCQNSKEERPKCISREEREKKRIKVEIMPPTTIHVAQIRRGHHNIPKDMAKEGF
jgi:hypothetical protein